MWQGVFETKEKLAIDTFEEPLIEAWWLWKSCLWGLEKSGENVIGSTKKDTLKWNDKKFSNTVTTLILGREKLLDEWDGLPTKQSIISNS